MTSETDLASPTRVVVGQYLDNRHGILQQQSRFVSIIILANQSLWQSI